MTNDLTVKQAVGELKAMKKHIEPYMSVVGVTAYDMAIQALELQNKLTEMLNKQIKAYAEQQNNRHLSDLEYGRKTAYRHCLEVLKGDE